MYQKKNFPVNTRVLIEKTTDPNLDGQTGTILGKSFVHVLDHYIVLLDVPLPDFRAITLTEACLAEVPIVLPNDDQVERASKAYAIATGYYVEFHRGLSSPSSDNIRKGVRAALTEVMKDLI